jgi:hypothetical protein
MLGVICATCGEVIEAVEERVPCSCGCGQISCSSCDVQVVDSETNEIAHYTEACYLSVFGELPEIEEELLESEE